MKTVMKKDYLTELRETLLADQEVQGMISMRAYEIYVSRGAEAGREVEDWFQAEREILAILIDEEIRRAGPPAIDDVVLNVTVASPEPSSPAKPKKARAAKKAETVSAAEATETTPSDSKSSKKAASVSAGETTESFQSDSKPAKKTDTTAKAAQKKTAAKGAKLETGKVAVESKKVEGKKKATAALAVAAAKGPVLRKAAPKQVEAVPKKSTGSRKKTAATDQDKSLL